MFLENNTYVLINSGRFLGFDFINFGDDGRGTTIPLLSAKCQIGVCEVFSPLHDKDKSNVEGQEYKKSHYHVIYVAANPVTPHSVRMRIQRALGKESIAKVQVIKQSMENMYLDLTHESKDAIAKNKYKYDKKDIQLLNSFDIDRYVVLDVEGKDEMLNDVYDMIDDHGLINIRELRLFVKEHVAEYNLPSMKIMYFKGAP